jgi:hypothetical protein
MIPDDQLNALKDRNPVHDVAAQWVTLRIKRKGKYVGPCPICSDDPHSKTASRFDCDADKWMCAVCADGGDVIKLVAKREALDFVGAVERLGGVREEVQTPALAHKAGLRAHQAGLPLGEVPAPFGADHALRVAWVAGWAEGRKRADYEAVARHRERARLYEFWAGPQGAPVARRWPGTPVEVYLANRGLEAPDNARLKYHPSMPLFCDGRERDPVLAHRGPAMLAALIGADGRFAGLHITWLDLAGPKGKAHVLNPETGAVLPSKKMRGTKAGTYIDLGGGDPAAATRMIAGEGTETVLAVYTALKRAGRDVTRSTFRAAGDLGNLAGRALATLAHPTLKTEGGRPQRVPGPDPDLTSMAMPVPDTVPEVVLLGDGDSDPFLTRNALERASRRHARDGRSIRVSFAAAGLDFNDMMQGKST